MTRRAAIRNIILFILGCFSIELLYKWFSLNAKPDLIFLNEKKTLIAEIAEMIIPRTDTPGAKDAKVEDFIIGMIKFCSDRRTQNIFIGGLKDLEQYSVKKYDRKFTECSQKDKAQIIQHFEDRGVYSINILNKINNKYVGKPFFTEIKELTVQGYCTSEIGATKGMAYILVPVHFQACIPIVKNQLSWATK